MTLTFFSNVSDYLDGRPSSTSLGPMIHMQCCDLDRERRAGWSVNLSN